ncbi:PrsW family glutamic-type intramembrane protease [Chloroflexota bacterium]
MLECQQSGWLKENDMVEGMVAFFVSGFVYPGILWTQVLVGIGLAVVFGAIWFAFYRTAILTRPWAWAILAGSAFLSWAAVSFIQLPLQYLTSSFLVNQFGMENYLSKILLLGIPAILLSGLVQEGGKLVPTVIYWWRNDKSIDPKMGLIIGAVAGLGLGVFEATWAHNTVLAAGWTWDLVGTQGLIALTPFWERLFAVGFHISVSALAGYGLAKGWGWQFYLLASLLHGLMNYSVALLQAGVFTIVYVEIYAALVAVLLTVGILLLCKRKSQIQGAEAPATE